MAMALALEAMFEAGAAYGLTSSFAVALLESLSSLYMADILTEKNVYTHICV